MEKKYMNFHPKDGDYEGEVMKERALTLRNVCSIWRVSQLCA